ncbi:MAG: 1-acyl-sn-glycerol-3-phosphate acyltransferase [Deltaproteobacteria bacterium]|nr:1-acyl-sn-glycerol-3-phosphate acyltransferase [Deltaproteobacteria bacterium]NNE74752.1 1-acyl-sn-glycerol-3-phosphate acyltransferase [Acidimicrobiales bacterium]
MTDDELFDWAVAVSEKPTGQKVFELTRWVCNHTILPYLDVTVRGRAKLNTPGPVIIAPVHRSNLDSLIVGTLGERRLPTLAKASLFKIKPFAWWIASLGAFPLQRGTADREAMKVARNVLDRGLPLLVFPEGTRQKGRDIGELFDGTTWLAAKTGAAIVPIGIAGTDLAMPQGARFPARTKVSVVVADPLDRPAGRVPRSRLAAMTTELHKRLQAANDQAHDDVANRAS